MNKNCTKYFPGWNAVYFIVSGIFIVWYSIEISVFSSCVYVRQWNTEFKLRFSFFHFRFVLPELITLRYLYACTITNYAMKWLSRLHYKIKTIQYKAGPWESRRTRLHQSLVFFFPANTSSVVSRLFVIDSKCLHSSGSGKIRKWKKIKFCFSISSYENERLLELCCPKSWENKNENRGWKSIFNATK